MLTGYKTKLGAAGLVLFGIAQIATALSEGGGIDSLSAGLDSVFLGLAAFGIGSKIDRK